MKEYCWRAYGGAIGKSGRAAKGLALVGSREFLAKSFYKNAGFDASRAAQHIAGIDINKAVQTSTLKKGTIVQQWVGENGVGNYFTPLENGAKRNLGLSDYDSRNLKHSLDR